ncbi:uncharacterized protein LOC127809682 isoform X2 [Diospyros lotus]|uniref:uncharacterized protein LOC127809682 isoform X2 n=1 Tax=Diospyros lotus TaxID=55363 RepID=UPI00224FB31D|nr:uncharacterized protein LOC127809682 isoform X2 [Diospyros lotus]
MGESSVPCLMRSFSQPAETYCDDPKEEDPLRALTTSISFGRFMTESLSWEKWSCFSNNRYLEEAEKFSKPGSVAEKKAYFEAHYNRVAARKAAAVLEQQSAASNNFSESSNPHGAPHDSSIVPDSSQSDSNLSISEVQAVGAPNTEQSKVVPSVDPNVWDPSAERNKLGNTEEKNAEPVSELVVAENPIQVDSAVNRENVENHIIATSTQQEITIVNAANQENLALTIKRKQSTRSPKFTNIRASKLWSSVKLIPVQPSKDDCATQIHRRIARDVVEKKRLTPKSHHVSMTSFSHRENLIPVELPNHRENGGKGCPVMPTEHGKMPAMHAVNQGDLASTSTQKESISSSYSFTNMPASKKQSSVKLSPVQTSKDWNGTQAGKKSARDLVEEKRPTQKSLHVPINFSSHSMNPIRVELPNKRENVEVHHKIVPNQEEEMLFTDAANRGNLVATSQKAQSNSSSKSFGEHQASKLQSSVKLSPSQRRERNTASQTSKMTTRDLVEKRKLAPKSLHMSINVSCHAGGPGKTFRNSLSIGNSKTTGIFAKTSNDNSIPIQTQSKASKRGLSVQPSATPQAERRSRLKTPGASVRKAQPPTVASSFSFRCEGRVAKRKEFFQKLQEKLNTKQTESKHVRSKPRKKVEDDFKELPLSTSSKAKSSEPASNQMNKIQPRQHLSPKLERKQIRHTDTNGNASAKDNSKPKHVVEKTQITFSSNSPSRKNTNENASPNIELFQV